MGNNTKRTPTVPEDKKEDNRKKIEHCVRLLRLPPVDMENPEQVLQRSEDYLLQCAEDGIRPTVSGFATSLKLSRITILNYVKGARKCKQETVDIIKMMYSTIQTITESGTLDGSINAVAGIFVMRNNFGYSNDDNRNAIVMEDAAEQRPSIEQIAAKYADAPD